MDAIRYRVWTGYLGAEVEAMRGLPFRLEIIEGATEWIVRCSSECGEASIRVSPPYSDSELQAVLARVENSLTKSYSAAVTRSSLTPERSVREFGKRLTGAVIKDKISLQLDRCKNLAKTQGRSLRILLRTDGPHVSRIPWEYLVDPSRDDYLALRVPVVRDLRLMDPIPPLTLTLPLRVLGISARPSDLQPLDEQRERERIAKALQRGSSDNVDVHWLPGGRWQDLAKALRSGTWHVLHCVCHGGFDEDLNAGYIQLSGDDGAAMRLHASDFERLIADSPHLRLIVLNACESAVSGAEDVFTSTAASLVAAGVPAVVAMQYEITDQAALVFASSFYERLADGLPVDRAVTLAREEVKMMRQGSLEWATPVLFLASDQTRVFAPAGEPQQPRTPHSRQSSLADSVTLIKPTLEQQLSEKIGVLAEVGSCSRLALGPANLLAAACEDGLVRVFTAVDGEMVAQCPPVQREKPICLAWSPWQRHVASRHEDGTVVVWDLQAEVPVRVISPGGQGDTLAFSADGRWLALSVENHVHVYDVHGARVRDLLAWPAKKGGKLRSGANTKAGPVIFAPGDRHLVVACGDGPVRQLNVRGQPVMTWPHHQAVLSLAFTEDFLATGCLDGQVRFWSWGGQLVRRTGYGKPAQHLAFSADFPVLAVADVEGTVTIRALNSGKSSIATRLASPPVGVAFLEGGRGLVTGTRTGAIERWALPDWMVEQGGAS
ncbi:CHAT domain-containing protein [Streptomyces sp. NPDC006251]|uniref:CHAT domain-containing protein n=1 Tax=Streptomyces sp. NPDC006251 TaxID=3155718 RepID=UPI0033A2450F